MKLLVSSFFSALNLLPLNLRIKSIAACLKLYALVVPSYRAVSFRNLKLAFPDLASDKLERIYQKNFSMLALALVDFARLHKIDKAWVEQHVKFPYFERYQELKENHPERPIIIATGHLGSFELQAYLVAVLGYPISMVVRNFTVPSIEDWWRSRREATGNEVIDRKGALKKILKNLKNGKDVALLFDQNIRRDHAVFVDWFGRKAATTKALGMAAVRNNAIIVVSSLKYLGNDRYEMVVEELNFDSIYADNTLTTDQKILKITEVTTRSYEKMIRDFPEGWFWMHRRWKTTQDASIPEDFYS